MTVSHVDYPPGRVGTMHHHAGFVLAYVLEGSIYTKISGQGEKTYNAGQMFYEQPGATHEDRATRARRSRRSCCDDLRAERRDAHDPGARGRMTAYPAGAPRLSQDASRRPAPRCGPLTRPPPVRRRATTPRRRFEISVREVEFRRTAAGRHADGAHLSAGRRGTVSHRARSARRRVEREGSPRRGADGSRARGERPAGRRDRHDAGAGSAVSGVRAGRQLRRALAQGEGGGVERRSRSKIGIYGSSSGGHVAELLAMRPRDPRYNAIPLPRGAERRCDGGLRRDALAGQQPVRALPECRAAEARRR